MKEPEARAREILKVARITSAPVNVHELARTYGAQLAFEPFRGGISGMLYRDERRKVIGVNSTHAHTRQRFTIAHELGHLLLHEERRVIVDRHVYRRDNLSSAGTEQEEIEANKFAAELLMPRALVQDAAHEILDQTPNLSAKQLVTRLASVFEVSPQAMEIRLGNLKILSPLIVESG